MSRKSGTLVAMVLFLVCWNAQSLLAQARILDIYPGTNVFGPAAQSLLAGDTLVVHQGIYNETFRMSIQVTGRSDAPITITGAQGEARPLITRPTSASLQNTINIEGSATWLALRGLEMLPLGSRPVHRLGWTPAWNTSAACAVLHVGCARACDSLPSELRGCPCTGCALLLVPPCSCSGRQTCVCARAPASPPPRPASRTR